MVTVSADNRRLSFRYPADRIRGGGAGDRLGTKTGPSGARRCAQGPVGAPRLAPGRGGHGPGRDGRGSAGGGRPPPPATRRRARRGRGVDPCGRAQPLDGPREPPAGRGGLRRRGLRRRTGRRRAAARGRPARPPHHRTTVAARGGRVRVPADQQGWRHRHRLPAAGRRDRGGGSRLGRLGRRSRRGPAPSGPAVLVRRYPGSVPAAVRVRGPADPRAARAAVGDRPDLLRPVTHRRRGAAPAGGADRHRGGTSPPA